MATYDSKPSVYEANGDGSYTYRWDIKEVEMAAGTEPAQTANKWECREIVVWGTVTSDKITGAVIDSLWPAGHEQKLVNEFNAANMGLYGAKSSEQAKVRIEAYKEFLTRRQAVKQQIDADCAALGIL